MLKSKKILVTAFLVFLSFCSFNQTSAQDIEDLMNMSLEEILNIEITVASKKAESINDAPGIVSVISRNEIEGFQGNNLGEILEKITGTQFFSANIFTDNVVSVRGQSLTPYNNHVLLLINGRPLRDPISGGLNSPTYNAFPIDIIDHIEVIRGPGSVLYGSCAYSGVINIVTQKKIKELYNAGIELSAGSFDTYGHSANLIVSDGALNAVFSAKRIQSAGPVFEFEDNPNPGKWDKAHWSREALGVFSNINYKNLSFNMLYEFFNPYALGGANENWLEKRYALGTELHYSFFFDGGYQKEFNDLISMNMNMTINRHRWHQEDFNTINGKSVLFEGSANMLLHETLNFIAGGTVERNDYKGERLINGDDVTYSVYSQLDYKPVQKLKLILGTQFNKIENIDGNLSPRIGAIFNLNEKIGVKALYSTAFRKAYPLETSFNHPVFRGNLEINPEEIATSEVQLFYQDKKIQSSLTYFKSELKDIIIRNMHIDETNQPYGFYFKYDNGGSHDYWGVEFENKFSITSELMFIANLLYQTNENSQDVENAALHPNLIAKAGILYEYKKFSLGLFHLYWSEPTQVEEVNPNVVNSNKMPEAVNYLSAKCSYQITDLLGGNIIKLNLEGSNLLDIDGRYPEYTKKQKNSLMPLKGGRAVFASVSLHFK